MRRRQFLSTVGVGFSMGFAGCSRSDSTTPASTTSSPTPPAEFTQCDKLVIRIPTLPDPAREEVVIALNEGQYETEDELYLPHVMPISESYLGATGGDPAADYNTLSRQDVTEHYRAVITQDGATNRLELEPAIPTWGTSSLRVENDTDESLTAEISIERLRDSKVVVTETVSVPADESTETAPFDQLFSKYRAEVTTDRFSDYGEWRVSELQRPSGGIVLTTEGIRVYETPTLEPVYCKEAWDSPSKTE